jgi:hypothetical protein
MSRYRKIDTRIWVDEKFRTLNEKEQMFFLYLLTSPHSTAWGAYIIDDLYIQADLGFSPAIIKSCWQTLKKTGLVIRCDQTRLVAFQNWFRYNLPANERTRAACVRGIISLPKSKALQEFISKSEWVSEQLANSNITLSELVGDEQGALNRSTEQGALNRSTEQDTPSGGLGGKVNGEEISFVFEHWKKRLNHPHAQPGEKRKKAIRERLKEGYTPEQLCEAIDGCAKSPWHQGANDKGMVYDSIELICRDAEHVDRFRKIAQDGAPQLSPAGMKTAMAAKEFIDG